MVRLGKNVGWKMVYNFLGNDEKQGDISILTFAKNIVVEKKSAIFRYSVSKQKPCDYAP